MAKHNYEDLYKNYTGFLTPTYKIVVNSGDELTSDDFPPISFIEVELTAGYEASACNLTFTQTTDYNTDNKVYGLDPFLKDKLKLGSAMEVALGYIKTRNTVFKGIITGVSLEYDAFEGIEVHVEAMDVKRLMMNSYHSYQPKKDLKKYGDAVKEVLKKYASNIGKQNVGETPERVRSLEQHNQSDYEFLVAMAKKINFAFYLINNDLYFEKFAQDTEPIIEISAAQLHSFYREITLADQIAEFTVRANDETDTENVFESTAKEVTAIGSGKKSSQDFTTINKGNAKKTIIDPSVSSANEAADRATAELAKHAYRFAQGTFKTTGIPEIVPGKMMTIKGFGDDYDIDYYIKKVTHHYSSEGYHTRGELGVNKI